MKNLLFLALLLGSFLFAAVAIADGPNFESKARTNLKTYTIEQICSTYRMNGFDWSHDGKWFVYSTDSNGCFNVWVVPSQGGEPRQLTNLHNRAINPTFSFDSKWIAFQSDNSGNEKFDVYVVPFDGGEPKNLTNTPNVNEHSPTFSPDGNTLAYCSNEKDPTYYQVLCHNMKDHSLKTITSLSASNVHPTWSPDGHYLAYTRTNDFSDSNVFCYDVQNNKEFCLTNHQGEKFFAATAWSPDCKRILLTSNAFNGYENVATVNVPSAEINWLTNGTVPCYAGNFNYDGTYASWTANNEGNLEIWFRNFSTNKNEPLKLAPGTSGYPSFSFADNRLAFFHESPTVPADIWTYDFKTNNSSPVTMSTNKNVDPTDLCEPYLVHYPTFDGKQVSAFLYLPFNLKKDGTNPAIVFAHEGFVLGGTWLGFDNHFGPTNQFTNNFCAMIQYFVNNGFIVLAPNYRGSSGFGHDFENLNNNDWAGGDLNDLVHGSKFLTGTGYVHPRRVALFGNSYGGYLTMMALAKYPDTFAAGIDFYGPSNLCTFFPNCRKDFQGWFKHEMGDFEKNKNLFTERSPITYASNFKNPLLVLHGTQDSRVPASESEQIVNAIQSNKGTIEYHVYPNEGHGFWNQTNQFDAYQRVATFLGKYLRSNQD